MHYNGEYPAYYMKYLEELNIVPNMLQEDKEILKNSKMDFIAFNYYRTLCARHLEATNENPIGTRVDEIDYDFYGYFKIEKNPNLNDTEYGAQIDHVGMRIALNEYHDFKDLKRIKKDSYYWYQEVIKSNGEI